MQPGKMLHSQVLDPVNRKFAVGAHYRYPPMGADTSKNNSDYAPLLAKLAGIGYMQKTADHVFEDACSIIMDDGDLQTEIRFSVPALIDLYAHCLQRQEQGLMPRGAKAAYSPSASSLQTAA